MNQISKVKVFKDNVYEDIIHEQELASKLNHPFIVSMNFSFQDKDYLFMINDLMSGGDIGIPKKKFLQKKNANL